MMDLCDFDIQEEFLFERTMYKFVAGETYTITNTNRIKAIDDALNIFQAAGSTHQVNRLVDHIKLVVKANQFHNDDFDALIEKWGGTHRRRHRPPPPFPNPSPVTEDSVTGDFFVPK
ncbi:hypothetical protein [Limosilactobacillus fermentum]